MRRYLKQVLSILLVTAMVCTGNVSTVMGAVQTEAEVAETGRISVDDSKLADEALMTDMEDDETKESIDETDDVTETDSAIQSANSTASTKTSRAKTEGTPVSDEEAEEIMARLNGGTIENPPGFMFRSYDISESEGIEEASLPEKFNPLDGETELERKRTLPSTRNQGSWGTCWAFSTIGLAEIESQISTRLSEYHLAYFTYNSVAEDPLGNLDGDNRMPFDANNGYMHGGGNNIFAAGILSSWIGAANAAIAPYPAYQAEELEEVSKELAFNDELHLQNYYLVDPCSERDSAKNLILQYGGIGILYYDDSYVSNKMYYRPSYNAEYNSWYCPEDLGTNHVVSIVGWDDNFSKYHFNDMPEGDGAWLIRNSWSDKSEYSNNSYFWMSYYDKSLYEMAVAFDFEDASNYDNNYQYDGGVSRTCCGLTTAANVYTATGAQKIEAVSFSTYDDDSEYTIKVYTGVEDDNPESGECKATVTVTTTYAGYYTIPLDEAVSVAEDTSFSVVVSLTNTKYDDPWGVNFEYSCTDPSSWFYSKTECLPGQSFFKSGDSWVDILNNVYHDTNIGNLCIKAFTNNDDSVTSPGKVNVYVNGEKNNDIKLNILERNSDGNYVKYTESEDNSFVKGKNIALIIPNEQFGDDYFATGAELEKSGSEDRRKLDNSSVNVLENGEVNSQNDVFVIPSTDTLNDINIYFTTAKFRKLYLYEDTGTLSSLDGILSVETYPLIDNKYCLDWGYVNYYNPNSTFAIIDELSISGKKVKSIYWKPHNSASNEGDDKWLMESSLPVKFRGNSYNLSGYVFNDGIISAAGDEGIDICICTETLKSNVAMSFNDDSSANYTVGKICELNEEGELTLVKQNTSNASDFTCLVNESKKYVLEFTPANGYAVSRISSDDLRSYIGSSCYEYCEKGTNIPVPNMFVCELNDICSEDGKVRINVELESDIAKKITAINVAPAYYKCADESDWKSYPADEESEKSIHIEKGKTLQIAYEYVEGRTKEQIVGVTFNNGQKTLQDTFPVGDAVTINNKSYTVFKNRITDDTEFEAFALPSVDALNSENVINETSDEIVIRYHNVKKWRGRYYALTRDNPTATIKLISQDSSVAPRLSVNKYTGEGTNPPLYLKPVNVVNERGRLVYSYTFKTKEYDEDYSIDWLNSSAGITVTGIINSSNAITSVNIEKLSSKSVLTADFNKISKYKVKVNNGAAADNLLFDVPGYELNGSSLRKYIDNDVVLEMENGVLYVDATGTDSLCTGKPKAGTKVNVTLIDGGNEVGAAYRKSFTIEVGAPVWKGSKPSVSLTGATDKSLLLKLGLPKGFLADTPEYAGTKYYYRISATPVNASETDLVDSEDLVAYVPVTCDSYEMKVLDRNLGEGHQAKFNIDAQIILADEVEGSDFTDKTKPVGTDIYATAAIFSLKNVSTRQPYYADTIRLKGVKTNIYAGEQAVKVATVDFGSKATYVSRDYWNVAVPAELGSAAVISSAYDNGVYINANANATPGTYEIKVSTKTINDNNGSSIDSPVSAVIKVKVLDTIGSINVSGPAKVYRKNQTTAVRVNTTRDIRNEQGIAMKSALVKYTLKYSDSAITAENPGTVADSKLATVDRTGI